MSKTKKIALTSVAVVSAGLTTANLTFTEAHAMTKQQKKDYKKLPKAQRKSIDQAYNQNKKHGILSLDKGLMVESQTQQNKSKAGKRTEHQHWEKRLDQAHKAGQTAYNRARREHKSHQDATIIASQASYKKAHQIAKAHYGNIFTAGKFEDEVSNRDSYRYTGKGKDKGKKAGSLNKSGLLRTDSSAFRANPLATSTPGKKNAKPDYAKNLSKHNSTKHTSAHHGSSSHGTNHTTSAVSTNTNRTSNVRTTVNHKATNTNYTTNLLKINTAQASTIKHGTKLSKDVKSLDSTNKKQAQAVSQLFGANKTVAKATGSAFKSAGKLAGSGLKATGKVKATANAQKGKITLIATGKGKTHKATGKAGANVEAKKGATVSATAETPAPESGVTVSDAVKDALAHHIIINDGVATPFSETETPVEKPVTMVNTANATNSNQANTTDSNTDTNAQTGLSQDVVNLDQQSQAQGQQLNNLLGNKAGATSQTGATTDETAQSNGNATDAQATDATANTAGTTSAETPTADPNVSPTSKTMNALQSLMTNKSSAKPTAVKASANKAKTTKTNTAKATSDKVATPTATTSAEVQVSNASTGAGQSTNDSSAKTGASSSGNVDSDVIDTSSTGSGATSGVKSSSADDGGSSNGSGTNQLPQTDNSANKTGIIAGSALVMSMAGLGLSAKVVKQRQDA